MRRKLVDSCLKLDKMIVASAASITLLTLSTMPTNFGKEDSMEMSERSKEPTPHYSGKVFDMNPGGWIFPSRFGEFYSIQRTRCDTASQPQTPTRGQSSISTVSKMQRILYSLNLKELPEPRLLEGNDPLFNYPLMKRGLKQRKKDEEALRSLQSEAINARNSGDQMKIQKMFEKISHIAYGKGVTPQMRENFLMKYGCTGYTDEIISFIVELCRERGIIEIGAGNGQWARVIHDYYGSLLSSSGKRPEQMTGRTKTSFIAAYDNMSDLPLKPKIYHELTQPAHDYFYPNVQKCDNPVDEVRRFTNRGRVLMLVFPPPGPMAFETVKGYASISPDENDTVIYVGEGKGGANADDSFFKYFTEHKEHTGGKYRWCLVSTMDVKPSPGGKAYEKLFVLKRVKTEE